MVQFFFIQVPVLGGPDEYDLRKVFEKYGEVESVEIPLYKGGRPTGYRFVNMANGAKEAMQDIYTNNSKLRDEWSSQIIDDEAYERVMQSIERAGF